MSTAIRRLIIMGVGLLAGIALWPVVELVLYYQASFPSYLLFVLTLGAASGLLMGGFFGSSEGITSLVKSRIPRGMITGALVGCIGGILGFFIGQTALRLIAELFMSSYRYFQQLVLPISRAIGWAFLGLFVGMAEGIRAGSLKKAGVGSLGGLLGGLVGGSVFQYAQFILPHRAYSRLSGLIILGLAIAIFYGLIERGASLGVLRILNGKLKGKEYPLNQNRLGMGSSTRNEICLAHYQGVTESQARLRVKRKAAVLKSLDPKHPVLVNERPIKERTLKFEDVLKIGSAKLIFKVE